MSLTGRPDVTGAPGTPEEQPHGHALPTPESDPDYRFTLANERTFLAWFRTALALIAGGVAVVQLIPAFAFTGARHALGVVLTVMGGVLSFAAVRRWQRVQTAMRRDEDLPPTRLPVVLGFGLAVLTAFVVVLILISFRSA